MMTKAHESRTNGVITAGSITHLATFRTGSRSAYVHRERSRPAGQRPTILERNARSKLQRRKSKLFDALLDKREQAHSAFLRFSDRGLWYLIAADWVLSSMCGRGVFDTPLMCAARRVCDVDLVITRFARTCGTSCGLRLKETRFFPILDDRRL